MWYIGKSGMLSHADHRGFECWVLEEEDIDSLLEVMGGKEEDSEIKIKFMCKNSERIYENSEECKTDENANEDPIECVFLEVSIPSKGKRELNFHHVGVKPSSATIVIRVTEEGADALTRKNKIVRRVRRMKPWWSWIAELEAEKLLLSLVAMVLACAISFRVNGVFEIHGMAITTLWLGGAFVLYAVLHIFVWLLGLRTVATVGRMTIFPQGITAIGEGKDRLEQVNRMQKTTGFVGSLVIAIAIAVIVALAL